MPAVGSETVAVVVAVVAAAERGGSAGGRGAGGPGVGGRGRRAYEASGWLARGVEEAGSKNMAQHRRSVDILAQAILLIAVVLY